MKQKFSPVYLSFWLLILAFIFISSKGNPPDGRTGAPGDGACTNCHGGNNAHGLDGSIEITGVPTNVIPNTTYPVTVTVSNPNAKSLWAGFQMVALNSSNTNAGQMSNPSQFGTITESSDRSYFEHNPAQEYGADNTVSWTVDWTAPNVTGSETITFYAAGNISDTLSNSNTWDDLIVSHNVVASISGGSAGADLTVSNLLNWGGSFNAGDVVNYNFDLNNFGDEVASGSFVINMYLSTDQSLSADDQWAGEVPTGNTPIGTIAGVTGAITVPMDLPSGNYYLIIVVDDGNAIAESNESNNVLVSGVPIQITSPVAPDLTVSNLANWGGTYSTGDVVSYIFDLNNLGNEVAFGSFVINMYLSTDQNFSPDDQWAGEVPTGNTPIGTIAGTPGAITVPVDLPDGNYYLIIVVDDWNSIAESNEFNNVLVSSMPIQVVSAVAPDLTVSNLSNWGGTYSPGEVVNYIFDLNNFGNEVAFGSFVINMYLSTDQNFSPDDQWAGEVPTGNTPIGTIAGTPGAITVPIDFLDGNYYLIIVVDDENAITESNESNNILVSSVPIQVMATGEIFVVVNGAAVSCFGGTDGVATAEISGGAEPYTYLWSNGASSATIGNLAAGNYTVTVMDSSGLSATGTVEITEPDNLLVLLNGVVNFTCAGDGSGQIAVGGTGGTMPYTYEWSNGATAATNNVASGGGYIVTITDSKGCTSSQQYFVGEPLTIMFNFYNTVSAVCGGSNNGGTSVSTIGGTGNITYTWSDGTTGNTISGLSPGMYMVTATDINGCVAVENFSVIETTQLVLTMEFSDVTCNGIATGSASVFASGGVEPYSYLWPNGNTESEANFLYAGAHEVTVTDGNDCVGTASVFINEPPPIEITFTDIVDAGCGNDATGSVTAVATGGVGQLDYLWSTGATMASTNFLVAGDYTVTVVDDNGCFASSSVAISTTSSIDLMITNITQVSCNGGADGSATATASGGSGTLNYSWSTGAMTQTINNLIAGVYFVTVSDEGDCSEVALVEIFEPNAMVVNIVNVENVQCPGDNNGAAFAEIVGGIPPYTFAWSTGSSNNLPVGEYSVVVTDGNGCSASGNFTITQEDTVAPVVATFDITVALGENGTVAIVPEMLDSGSFDNCGIVEMFLDVNSFNCLNLGENVVTLTVVDGGNNNTSAMAVVTVVDNTPPEMTCAGDIFSMACGVPLVYDFPLVVDNCVDNVTLTMTSGLPSGAVFPVGETILAFEATDASGNMSTCSFRVIVDNTLTVNVATLGAVCNGSNSGEAVITSVIGGSPDYTYLWSTGDTTTTIAGLASGGYSLSVTDAAGCIAINDFTIGEPPALQIALDEITDATAAGNDGSIAVTISGGTTPYSYSWLLNGSEVSTMEDPSGLVPGVYTLLVIDVLGCELISENYTVEMMVNVENIVDKMDFRLYPNPTTGIVNISWDVNVSENIAIGLHDMTGKEVIMEQAFKQGKVTLDWSALQGGVYFVKINTERETFLQRVVLVN